MRRRDVRRRQRIKNLKSSLLESVQLYRSALDSLSAIVAILSEDGTILSVNRSWREFGAENTPPEIWDKYEKSALKGSNYLDVCDKAVGRESHAAHVAAAGIRSVAAGSSNSFVLEYPCHSPTERQWYRLRVTPMTDGGTARLAVVHEDITLQKLAEEQLKHQRKRIAAKLLVARRNRRIAEMLQQALLQKPPEDYFPGVEFTTLYIPSSNEAAVGGDFFDIFALDEHHVAFVLGDVSGKGLLAASRITEAKYALRTLMHEHRRPDIVLTKLNEFLYASHVTARVDVEAFIVISIALVNTISGAVSYSAAGAQPSLVLRANSNIERVATPSTPIGMLPDSTYQCVPLLLQLRDTLLMATDGIVEAHRGSAFLGIDGLEKLAKTFIKTQSLAEVAAAIYNGTFEFAGGHLNDDVCILLARKRDFVE